MPLWLMVNREALRKRSRRRLYIAGGVVAIALLTVGGVWAVFLNNNTAPACTPTSKLTCARIETSLGTFEVELYKSATPATVANFVSLSKAGFYNHLVWHRIVAGFVIQTGDATTKNGGGDRSTWGNYQGTLIPFEYNSTIHNRVGYLGMASTAAKAGGSTQFYINLVNNPNLDSKYAVFGKVVSGMDVVQAIGRVQVNGQDQPVDPVYVTAVTISEVA